MRSGVSHTLLRMPIRLEGQIVGQTLPDGNKIIAVAVGPGVEYHIVMPPQAWDNVKQGVDSKIAVPKVELPADFRNGDGGR